MAAPIPDEPPLAAEAYAALGWPVVPIIPGGKHPQLNAWQEAATDDLEIIRSWWTGLYRGHGVGIICGPRSGFWVLDVDVADNKPGRASLEALNEAHGKLPVTVTAITGSGGLHLLFAWNPDQPVTNGDAARLGPGLDIRGAGGQIVVAPTTHPNGSPYRWMPDRDPWSLPLAPAPNWLYNLIHPVDEAVGIDDLIGPTTPTGVVVDLAEPESDSIAEWIRARHDWATELNRDGWTLHSHKPNGDTWWTRPGKSTRDGHSAVLHAPDGPLVIFTTEIPSQLSAAGTATADGSGISVSMFGYLAGMHHGGDRSALARTARIERNRIEAPTTAPTADPAPSGFVDLGSWWDDPTPAKQADVCTRTDGVSLLYADQLNWVHGDSGSGKTWVLLHAMAQLITAGTHVAWVHYEDPNPIAIVQRLKLLGIDRDTAITYFHYYDPAGAPLDAGRLIDLCQGAGVMFVGLDSIGEALNAEGVNEDSDVEVGPWISRGPRAIVNAGIGFAGVDHGTKAGTHKLHPSGSKRKRAALTGAGLLVELITAPTSTGRDGEFRITCAKDRHGNHPQGQVVGIAHLRHNITTGGLDFAIVPPSTVTPGDVHGHDKLVREVIRAVGIIPGLSRTQLRSQLPMFGREKRDAAIDAAIASGAIVTRPGARNAQCHFLIDGGDNND